MLGFDEGKEVFFDAADCLGLEECGVVKDLEYSNSGYEIWKSEPKSVKERRESFLRSMGFVEFAPSHLGSEMLGFERIIECSGAVSSSCVEKNEDCYRRELNGEANCMVGELGHDRLGDVSLAPESETARHPLFVEQFGLGQAKGHVDECTNVDFDKKKVMNWWKSLKYKMKRNHSKDLSGVCKPVDEAPKVSKMKVQQNKKSCKEFSAVYVGQEFRAHEGLIWTMKFSPDGQYLASGGEDGVVRIWHVTSVDTSCKSFHAECTAGIQRKEGKSSFGMKRSSHASVVVPDNVFQIEELPLQEFRGHSSDVLDLAWSNSNCLLSSSKDKTVRLWQVGRDKCLGVFRHNNYVTCIQFNPVDENYFISGSIDGKVRIWGVSERRVVEWANVRDVVTAICYQPNGKGFIVGSLTGTCRFYEASGSDLLLNAEIRICGRKKSSGNKITGIQFSQEDSQRVMISSEDSKVRILDGVDVVHKYRGLPKSGSQMSASFTSTGKHIISVGDDSRVYVWNYDDLCVPSTKQKKSIRSCEHFFFEGVSVAIPWSGMEMAQKDLGCGSLRLQRNLQTEDHQEASSWVRDSDRFSLSNWFFMDGSCRGSATWPEEKLPLSNVSVPEHDHWACNSHGRHHQQHDNNSHKYNVLSTTWGLVIVTAGSDGIIRTFQNYGLPVRI